MSDNYIWTMKDLKRNMLEDQEFIIDFDETSKDDLQWVEDSIFGVLSNLPYLKVMERKLEYFPKVNRDLERVIKDLNLVTSVIWRDPLDKNAEDYVVSGTLPPYAKPHPYFNSKPQSLVRNKD